MRATTAIDWTLVLPGASVCGVRFAHDAVVVAVRLRRRRRVCSTCGAVCRATHDTVLRRWRHLDLGAQRCFIVAAPRRVKCPDCGVRLEAVPWSRGARFTRDLEDVVAFLASRWPRRRSRAMVGDRVVAAHEPSTSETSPTTSSASSASAWRLTSAGSPIRRSRSASSCPSTAHEATQRRRAHQIAIRRTDRRGLALRAQMAHVSAVAKAIQTA